MLLVYINSYQKSVQVHKFLVLDSCHQDTVYLRQQRCDDPWLFFETQRGSRPKKIIIKLGNIAFYCSDISIYQFV
jgi:hypothetical protein